MGDIIYGGHIAAATNRPAKPITWSVTAMAKSEHGCEFESALLAIAGHDLRQPLQVIQSAYELLRIGDRTNSELRLLRTSQSAIDRLKEQLDQLVSALRLREHANDVRLTAVPVGPLLQQACNDNEDAALKRGLEFRLVSTSVSVESNPLLLSSVLRNLVSNAVKYTQPGGRILLGCRHAYREVRIDVYDTGIGIAREQIPRVFEAFTRIDFEQGGSLGIGLFIVREAIGILGHRLEVASELSRGSRFSIFATRAGDAEDSRT
jgi:two-component system, OmpR family, phosphate regulon sensor histidine kinase PhoR